MKILDQLNKQICNYSHAEVYGQEAAVSTHCLYPSNGNVTVYVSGGARECVVTDRGDAMKVIRSHGIEKSFASYISSACNKVGLIGKGSVIRSPAVSPENILQAIILVANTASKVVTHAVNDFMPYQTGTIDDAVRNKLYSLYGGNAVRSGNVLGYSNKQYSFEFLVNIDSSRTLIVDKAVPHAHSVNAKVATHFDISSMGDTSILQTIIYDEEDKWKASDLSLMESVTSSIVPVNKMKDFLPRLAVH